MSKKYWLFDKETLIINHTAQTAIERPVGVFSFDRRALEKEPLTQKDGYQVLAVLNELEKAIDTEYVEDHRGKTIYNTADCTQSKTVEKLGSIEDGYTLLVPSTIYDEWIGEQWVTNTVSQYQAQYSQVAAKRSVLYSNVDKLYREAAMIRETEKDEEKASEYEAQGKALYLKIREENPWPELPQS